jgi:hypothetical protein
VWSASGSLLRGLAAVWFFRPPQLLLIPFVLTLLHPSPVSAQLRPWEPFDWSLFDGVHANIAVGTSVLWGPRASLAGTGGVLVEAGTFAAGYRIDRVGLEAGGTFYRRLREEESFAPPTGGTEPRPLGVRHDTGDYRISTGVALTRPDRAATLLLRFGSRLPTTDNRVGLERDATDFFATLGARADIGVVRAFGELGVGIHGTRKSESEQSDLLLYMVGIGMHAGPIRPTVVFLGQTIDRHLRSRGTEPLSEIRLQIEIGGRVSGRVEAIHGFTPFSPEAGVSLSVVGGL